MENVGITARCMELYPRRVELDALSIATCAMFRARAAMYCCLGSQDGEAPYSALPFVRSHDGIHPRCTASHLLIGIILSPLQKVFSVGVDYYLLYIHMPLCRWILFFSNCSFASCNLH